MLPSGSPVGEMNWGKVFLRLEVPGLSFTCACANTRERSADRESVQIHESGEATNMESQVQESLLFRTIISRNRMRLHSVSYKDIYHQSLFF